MAKSLNVPAAFLTGVVSHGLLAIGRHNPSFYEPLRSHVLRRSLQGGIALGGAAIAYNHLSANHLLGGTTIALGSALAVWVTRPNFSQTDSQLKATDPMNSDQSQSKP
ncbi:hypothetical protein [Desulfurispira natronophila]|uniref:Uncharacterized protein n=1 Tax=Desulfurispira natronophila TaxID=682562 RepID=A0A7W7Y403_9BACT|nr:hypothetical protein [Desulfurispira natronophila]MBB5021519.1 hypothetical protein [Desulfurispira natronophila]